MFGVDTPLTLYNVTEPICNIKRLISAIFYTICIINFISFLFFLLFVYVFSFTKMNKLAAGSVHFYYCLIR